MVSDRVRMLTEADTATNGRHVFYGQNVDVLRDNIPDVILGLRYIDPPFNSTHNYNQIYTNFGEEDRAQAQAFTLYARVGRTSAGRPG